MENIEYYYNLLLEMGVSEETLQLITSINGYNMETLRDILYAKFGYNDFEEFEKDYL